MTSTEPPNPQEQKSFLKLRLYIADGGTYSLRAAANLKRYCETHLKGMQLEVETVDVIANPLKAVADGILVTPTLLKVAPPPTAIIIGDLHNIDTVFEALIGKKPETP